MYKKIHDRGVFKKELAVKVMEEAVQLNYYIP